MSGLPLRQLELHACGVSNLEALAGMPLHELRLSNNNISNIDPLSEVPLRIVVLNNNPLTDIRPLTGIDLLSLDISRTQVADIRSLAAGQVTIVNLLDTLVPSLDPLADSSLVSLYCGGSALQDLQAIKGWCLSHLRVNDNPYFDGSLLADHRLVSLALGNLDRCTDLSPLRPHLLKDFNTRLLPMQQLGDLANHPPPFWNCDTVEQLPVVMEHHLDRWSQMDDGLVGAAWVAVKALKQQGPEALRSLAVHINGRDILYVPCMVDGPQAETLAQQAGARLFQPHETHWFDGRSGVMPMNAWVGVIKDAEERVRWDDGTLYERLDTVDISTVGAGRFYFSGDGKLDFTSYSGINYHRHGAILEWL